MKIPFPAVPVLLCVLPLLASSCANSRALRHKDQSVTVSKRAFFSSDAARYWMVGAKPGQITNADDVAVYRKAKGSGAAPVKCSGFIDTTRPARIEVRLAEKHGGSWEQARVNGSYKLADENSPRPFYHWLIP